MFKKILRYLIMFCLGACAFGLAQSVILTVRGRVGTVGGEVFLLPFLAGMVYIGWMLSETYHRDKLNQKSRAIYKKGFIDGGAAALKNMVDIRRNRGGQNDKAV